jgi:hypothetical protein
MGSAFAAADSQNEGESLFESGKPPIGADRATRNARTEAGLRVYFSSPFDTVRTRFSQQIQISKIVF